MIAADRPARWSGILWLGIPRSWVTRASIAYLLLTLGWLALCLSAHLWWGWPASLGLGGLGLLGCGGGLLWAEAVGGQGGEGVKR